MTVSLNKLLVKATKGLLCVGRHSHSHNPCTVICKMLMLLGGAEAALHRASSTFNNKILKLTKSEHGNNYFVAQKSLNCTSGKTLKLRFLDTSLDLLFQNLMSSSLDDSPSSHKVSSGIRPAEEVKI